MKVLHIVPSPAITGPVTVAHDLVLTLQKKITISIAYFDEKAGYRWDNGQKLFFLKAFELFGIQEYDIFHSHTLRPDIFTFIHKLLKPKTTTVCTLHNYFYEEYRLEYPKIPALIGILAHHWSLRNKSALVAITPHMQRFYQQKGFKNIHYIPNTRILKPPAEDNHKIAENIKKWADGNTLLMTLGTANERKNLQAVLPVLKKNPDWRWVHVGDGPLLPELKTEVEHLRLHNRVYFAGYVSDGNQLLSVADVLLLPSLSEGFPLVVLEAFQRRVPVVLNDIPTFEGLFSDEVVKCNVKEELQFSRAIHFALEHRDSLCMNATARFDAEFSPQAVATAYLRLYESLL
ncbi:MAG: glycosyltransferase family 4 protein [Thermaurantimonas sp.]|uniref:glycosyltransferase family 4 protein n=1 Tax=Thermaurantimonas sp. TaxID=2681568 RepID=UPI00391DAF09